MELQDKVIEVEEVIDLAMVLVAAVAALVQLDLMHPPNIKEDQVEMGFNQPFQEQQHTTVVVAVVV